MKKGIKPIKNAMCKVELKECFKDLRKYAEKNDRYWSCRYFERIIGISRTLWYMKQITEKQYDLIFDIANNINSYGIYKKTA
jgi:hypothetical protein